MSESKKVHPLARSPLSDADVVDRVLEGDRNSYEILMRRHNQRVFRTARSVLSDDAEAQDAAQQAWLLAYRNLSRWERRGAFTTWLLRITVREALRRRGASYRTRLRLVESPVEPNDEPRDSLPASPEVEAARGRLRIILEDAIDALPEGMREILVLRDIEEMSGQETADVLGMTDGAVRVRLHRARRMLRNQLEAMLADKVGEAFPFLGERCNQIVAEVFASLEPAPPAS